MNNFTWMETKCTVTKDNIGVLKFKLNLDNTNGKKDFFMSTPTCCSEVDVNNVFLKKPSHAALSLANRK